MPKETLQKHLNKILDFIDVSPEVSINEAEGALEVNIVGDNLNFLIGYRGESLDALQYILAHAVFKEKETWTPISLDIIK